MTLGAAIAVTGLMVLVSPAPAHHSYAMFDRTQTLTVSGTVRTFLWANPHVYLWVYVDKDLYAFEFGGGPNALVRSGWSKETLKAGDKITVTYNPLKDGRTGGEFVSVVLPDGSHLDSNGAIGQDGEHRVP
jgi:hypothetical protein